MAADKKPDNQMNKKGQLILQKATEMFLAQGFNAVSMDALAEAVPVSKPTLYNHYKDKKALFIAVMSNRCNQLFATLEQSIQIGGTPKDVLTHFGRKFLDMVLDPNAIKIYRVAFAETQHFPEMGALFYESGPKRTMKILADYLTKLDKAGTLHVAHPDIAAGFFFGMLKSKLQMQCLMGLASQVTAQKKRQTVEYAVDVFLNGLKR